MEKRHSWAISPSTMLIMYWLIAQQVSAMPMAGQMPPPPSSQGQGIPQPTAQAPQPQGIPVPQEQGLPDTTVQQQPQGPDTVDSTERTGIQGNWVKKRQWLMDANTVNNQIQDLAAQNEPLRKTFIDKYNQIQANLDTYYANIGLQQGLLQELFDGITRYLEKKRKGSMAALTVPTPEKPDPEMQAKIDTIEASIKESKQQLEQLMLDMKSIEDLDRSLQDRIKRFDEYCNTMQEDANRAKSIVNEMWNVIDHNIARDRYYELNNNILEKIKATQAFLQNEFSQDFDTVGQTIATQITKTEGEIKTLEAKGFIIKNRTQRLKEERIKEAAQAKTQAAKEEVAKKTSKTTPSWYSRMYDSIVGFFSYITQSVTATWRWLTGGDAKQATTQTSPTSTPPPLPKEIQKPATTPAASTPPTAPAAMVPGAPQALPQALPAPQQPTMPPASPTPPSTMPLTMPTN